jgi:hypothetical protein
MTPGCGEGCANKWRGMLYGMTNRAGWNGHDPNNNKGIVSTTRCASDHPHLQVI